MSRLHGTPPLTRRMRALAQPRLSVAAQRLMRDRRSRRRGPAERREARAEATFATVFVGVAIALPLVFGGPRPSALEALALVVTFALLCRVEFDVGAGYTTPVQLVFVPMLFAGPAWAPALAAAGMILGRLPDGVRHHNPGRHVLVGIGNSWFAVAPALVLAAHGIDGPAWADWPIYALALAAQFATDTAVGSLREWWILGVAPRLQLRMMGLVFLTDTLLAPIGLLAALASESATFAFLAVVPLAGLLTVFARERGARIDQAIELSSAYRGTALLLGEVVLHDDEYTGEHSQGVIELALAVAREMRLGEDDQRLVEFGALLHDVGKIAVPKEIVNKPGPLDESEWAVMRRHTLMGQQMLDRVGGTLKDVGEIVRASHEHWDGGGYPDGLVGEQIPLASRIISVADAYSAITTSRPYRAARSRESALAELRACAGTQFDPVVVKALLNVLGGGPSRAAEVSPRLLQAMSAAVIR